MTKPNVAQWVYAALCAWADRNGDVQVVKLEDVIRLYDHSGRIGLVTVEEGHPAFSHTRQVLDIAFEDGVISSNQYTYLMGRLA